MTQAKLGARPGTLVLPEDTHAPLIRVIRYGPGRVEEHTDVAPDALAGFIQEGTTCWIDIHGLGDHSALHTIGRIFELHPIELENAINIPQRPKSEVYGPHHLMVVRVPLDLVEGHASPAQVSILAGRGFVLTLQARSFGLFESVRARLRAGNPRFALHGPGYLCYALIDAVVDHYLPVVEQIDDRLDVLEEHVEDDGRRDVLAELHSLRRALAVLRRIGSPQLEALNSMLRDPSPVLDDAIRSFLRDAHDHMALVMGQVEAARESAVSLAELYLSQVSYRTNEIMKVLTLISSLFIPLTFIVGIYGMNFEQMPELRHPWGYPAALGVMALVAVAMLFYFRHKGWLGGRPPRGDGDE